MPGPGAACALAKLGLVSRRTLLKCGIGLAAGAALPIVGVSPAQAGLNKLAKANARFVRRFTGADLTGPWAAHYVDLCIPVQRADGSLLFIGGDTYTTPPPLGSDWRAPVGLIASPTNPTISAIVINGAVTDTGSHAKGLVPEPHGGKPPTPTTALPSDVFRVGNTLYMHLMRGPIYQTHHTDFWRSQDNGVTWQYLRKWPSDLYDNQFQQKTYAADTNDAYVYVMSTIFDRTITKGLLLFRVLKSDLDKTDADADASGFGAKYAYQGWGYANGRWAWGNQPTTITDPRRWGEICFRAMDGKYALSWFQPNNNDYADIRAQVFPLPTSNLITTTEQTMVYNSRVNPSSDHLSVQPALYGGFVIPGSTFDNFNITVSTWIPSQPYAPQNPSNYTVSQWRTRLTRTSEPTGADSCGSLPPIPG
jgi:Domain of unknown function (DUF4185)